MAPRLDLLAAPSVGAFLRAWSAARAEHDPAFSMRAVGRALQEANPTVIHSVARGDRRLGLEQALRWLPRLELSPSEAAVFLALVRWEAAGAALRQRQARLARWPSVDAEGQIQLAREALAVASAQLEALRPVGASTRSTEVSAAGREPETSLERLLGANLHRQAALDRLSGAARASPLVFGLTEATSPAHREGLRQLLDEARGMLKSLPQSGPRLSVTLTLFPLSRPIAAQGEPRSAPPEMMTREAGEGPDLSDWTGPSADGARGYLRAWLAWRRASDPGYSYADFARQCGQRDRAILWKILEGRQRLTPLRARAFALGDGAHPGMGLDPDEADLLARLAARDMEASPAARALLQQEVDQAAALRRATVFPARRARALEGWAPYAIHELALCEGFVDDPVWISDALDGRISPAEVKAALDSLFSARLLSALPEGLRPAAQRWQLDRPAHAVAPDEAVLRYHQAMALQEERSLRAWGSGRPEAPTMGFALRLAIAPEALRPHLVALHERAQAVCAGPGARDQVVQVCVQACGVEGVD